MRALHLGLYKKKLDRVTAMNRGKELVCYTTCMSHRRTKKDTGVLVDFHFTELFSNSSGPKVKTSRNVL